MDHEIVKKKHKEIFGEDPELIVFAPGRVNIIGEHTDYNDGYVLPMAINMGITLAISKIPGSKVIAVYSVDYDKKMVSLYGDLTRSQQNWLNYPVGVVKGLLNRGFQFEGIRITFTGNIPQGAGLSSSAAIEIAVAYGIQQLYNLDIKGPDLAKICQKAEHDVVGVRCGIMDQYISRMAKKDTALFIDCRTLDYELIPLKLGSIKLVITNSNVPHKLSQSKYNERVGECQEAVKIFESSGDFKALRDITMEFFDEHKSQLPEIIQKRAFHVISENQRVLQAKEYLKANDLRNLGKLLIESHKSLKENYEVSSKELDWLVENSIKIPGCLGARMTGAGFGGCTIALFEENAVKEYKKKLEEYEGIFGFRAIMYESPPVDGVHEVWKA